MGGGDDEQGGEVFHHLAVADLAVSARHPAGAGDWPGQSGIGELHEVDSQGDREDDEDEREEDEDEEDKNVDEDQKNGKGENSPVALAHPRSDVGTESPQGSRNPNHSSKDEESKLSHLLLSRQIFSTSSHS